MAGTPIKFEIVKHIGVINRNDRGWTKELNIVKPKKIGFLKSNLFYV